MFSFTFGSSNNGTLLSTTYPVVSIARHQGYSGITVDVYFQHSIGGCKYYSSISHSDTDKDTVVCVMNGRYTKKEDNSSLSNLLNEILDTYNNDGYNEEIFNCYILKLDSQINRFKYELESTINRLFSMHNDCKSAK